ncbi:protoporphyrinogen oxidase [Cydia fagiglandana]|uniref:protoporphyrinogen oxidase n=1 Tax=Cydia fagiglandana TaxID=1458189 RepID=UPI002FEE2D42
MAAILGGGLGGLSTGYYLLKNNLLTPNALKLYLLEASNSCGGWIKSIKTKDYVFEQGPRTIRPKGTTGLNTLNMMQDLGLSEHISPITPEHPAAKNRLIYVNHSLHLLPSSLISVFQTKQPFSKPLIYAAFTDLKQKPKKEMKDDSIYNFVERRFGKEIADYAISPMICGICAGDAKEISVKFLMKTLFEWEQSYGGVLKGFMKTMFKPSGEDILELSDLAKRAQEEKWNVYTIKGGLATFPSALYEHLKTNNVAIQMNSKIEELEFIDSSTVVVKNASGEQLKVNHVYSSIPSHSLAQLVGKQHPPLAECLNEIPFVTVGIVNLFFATRQPITPAFGFLVPPIENSPILGVVFDSCCMPDQNGTVLTVMLGGRWFKEKFGDNVSEQELLSIAMKEIQSILNIKEQPTDSHVNILEKCIPQYVIGHYERVDFMRKYIRNHNLPISIVGSSYDGVGINDVIFSAKKQVEECA